MTPCSIPTGLHHPVCRIKSGVRLPTEALHVAHSPNAHDEKPQRSQLPHELLEQPPQLDEEDSDDDIIMPTGPPPPQRPRSKMMSSSMPSTTEMASSPIKYSPPSLKAHEQDETPFENEAFKNLKSQETEGAEPVAIIESQPQMRDFRKENTVFVPSTVLRRQRQQHASTARQKF